MPYKIALVPGDGIGPEIIASAVEVLNTVAARSGKQFIYTNVLAGGCSLDRYGVPLTDEALNACLHSDSVLLGAVGGPKWDTLEGGLRPERALLGIRKELGLYTNIRPARLFTALRAACPLRQDKAEKGFHFIIIRELTGGMYYGARGRRTSAGGAEAYDTECYSEMEIGRIARSAFRLAMQREKRVVSIDKANVLESSRLWRETVRHIQETEFPEVTLTDMLVDNAAMQLIRNPSQFDVVVTSNMFGDILSDEASELTGSIGLLPSASLGDGTRGMYEPIHGSAPDIAGKNIANPLATILSAAMMLDYSFGLQEEAAKIERAVEKTLLNGVRTADICEKGKTPVSTTEMTAAVLALL